MGDTLVLRRIIKDLNTFYNKKSPSLVSIHGLQNLWAMTIISIIKKGKENMVADALSRVNARELLSLVVSSISARLMDQI